jgi:hypothetical protein
MDGIQKPLTASFPADRQLITVGIYYEKLQVLERWFGMPRDRRGSLSGVEAKRRSLPHSLHVIYFREESIMDVEKVKRIPLPEGKSGNFLITHKMLEDTGNGLEALDDAITVRAVELGINLMHSVAEERRGFRVSWRPY